MKSVLNIRQVGFYCWDITNDRFYLDAICAELFGIPVKQGMLGISIFQVLEKVDLDHRNRVIETALTTLKNASFYDQEYAVRRTDGSVSWVRTLGRYLVDEDNIPFKRLGTMEEISPPERHH
ncbi:PAS domain-containing protein [Agrobacterium sp. DKPNP3]|uniref:PAS domain-containing protein n=1 Tax=Agrobacterium sp. DKPNP3 TaxID=3457323 RepID=UPI004044BA55